MIAISKNQPNSQPVIGLNAFDRYVIGFAALVALLAGCYLLFYRGDNSLLTDGSEPIATVVSTSNTVKKKSAGQVVWEKASEQSRLSDQDQVFTDQGATALIALDGSGDIEISENSLVVIESGEKGSSLDVMQGSVFVTLSDNRMSLAIKIRNTVTKMVSKNARVQFRAEKGNMTSVLVLGGEAILTGQNGEVRVGSNQLSAVDIDGTIGPVRKIFTTLLEPVHKQLITAPNGSIGSEVNFIWQNSAGADTFRIEVSRNELFTEMAHATGVTGSSYTLAGLDYGRYFWRVSAMDLSEVFRFGETRMFEIVEDLRPILVTPSKNFRFDPMGIGHTGSTSNEIAFEWISRVPQSGYLLEVYREKESKENLIQSITTRDMSLRLNLPAGPYIWSVTPVGELKNRSKIGSFSIDSPPALDPAPPTPLQSPFLEDQYDINLEDSGSFIQPILDFLDPAAYAADSELEGGKYISWKSIPGAAGYLVEIARDDQFNDIFVSEKVDTPGLKWPKKASGKYFMRVSAIDKEGRNSPPSNVAIVYAKHPAVKKNEPLTAPKTQLPIDNEIFQPISTGLAKVNFAWISASKNLATEIQVARDNVFKQLVLTRENISGSSFTTTIGPGNYFHRVRSLRQSEKGPFSSPGNFVVLQVPPSITSPGPNSTFKYSQQHENTLIKWLSQTEPTKGFLLEISKDENFKINVTKYDKKDSTIDLDLPSGIYFVRVRLAPENSPSSDFSLPVKFTVLRPTIELKKRKPRVWRPLSPFVYAGYYPAFVAYQLNRGDLGKKFDGEYATSFKVAIGMNVGPTQSEVTHRYRETTFVGSEKVGDSYIDLETTKRIDESGIVFRRKLGNPNLVLVWVPEIGYSKRQIELFNIDEQGAVSFETVTTQGLMIGLNTIILLSDSLTASIAADYTSLSKFSASKNSEGISNEVVGISSAVFSQASLNWEINENYYLLPTISYEQISYSLENNVGLEKTDIKITELGFFVGGGYAF